MTRRTREMHSHSKRDKQLKLIPILIDSGPNGWGPVFAHTFFPSRSRIECWLFGAWHVNKYCMFMRWMICECVSNAVRSQIWNLNDSMRMSVISSIWWSHIIDEIGHGPSRHSMRLIILHGQSNVRKEKRISHISQEIELKIHTNAHRQKQHSPTRSNDKCVFLKSTWAGWNCWIKKRFLFLLRFFLCQCG